MSQRIASKDVYATLSMELQKPIAASCAQFRETLCVMQTPKKLKCMSSI